jgi:transcriptional regulator CtsR
VEKRAKKDAKRAATKELFGYTDQTNPFGDASLTKAFVWGKKYEAESKKKGGAKVAVTKSSLHDKQRALTGEIAKVKKRRTERAEEQRMMDGLKEQMQRGKSSVCLFYCLPASSRWRCHHTSRSRLLFHCIGE